MSLEQILEDLARPFPPHRISWRVGNTNAKKIARETGQDIKTVIPTKGQVLAYINARDVMQRLDDVVGAANWADAYAETPSGRVLCTLELRIGEDSDWKWVGKSDGAGDTSFEGAKGAISDAFKRAAVKWGIFRYGYEIEAPWVTLNNGYLPKDFDGQQYLPAASAFSSKQMRTSYWKGLKDAASEDDSGKARELWNEMTSEQQTEVWGDLSSGIRSTIKELLAATGATA